MSYKYKFQTLLQLREQEREDAFQVYQQSVKTFEEAANKLYELLKKKEDLEAQQLDDLQTGLPVHAIKHYQQFINNLEQSIQHSQKLVMNTRNHMNWHEEKLKESTIEMKKYEKLKQKGLLVYKQLLDKMEDKQLDEFATQQFAYREGS